MLPGKTPLACLIASLAFGCQLAGDDPEFGQTNQEILGGTPLSVGQFSTVVAMLVDGGQRGLCTGTLVAPDLVITAAHCVDHRLAGYGSQQEVTQNTIVVIDSSDLRQNGQSRGVVETARVQSFNNPGDPDVGIIRLSQPVLDRTPTRVNFEPARVPVGTTVTMVGYGLADDGQAGKGFVLQNRSSQTCAAFGVSDSNFLCFSQSDGKGKCQGDSGGPSFSMIDGVETLVGITSFGDQNCAQLGADFRPDSAAARQFFAANAPDLLCANDGHCDSLCGANGVPVDPDCGAGCATDADCTGAGQLCNTDEGTCYAGPDAPGGLGSACGDGLPACQSGICATYNGDQVCTETCDTGAANCPTGFECVGTGAGTAGACFEEGGGCCSASGGGSSGAAVLTLFLLCIGLRRRRRR